MKDMSLVEVVSALETRLSEEKENLELSLSITYINYYQGKVQALKEVLDYLDGEHEEVDDLLL